MTGEGRTPSEPPPPNPALAAYPCLPSLGERCSNCHRCDEPTSGRVLTPWERQGKPDCYSECAGCTNLCHGLDHYRERSAALEREMSEPTSGRVQSPDKDGDLWVHGTPARSFQQVADYLTGDAHDRSKVQVYVGGRFVDVALRGDQ